MNSKVKDLIASKPSANLSPDSDDAVIGHLRNLIQHQLPSMPITLQPPTSDEIVLRRDNADLLTRLINQIKQDEPNAGRFYWSAQSWNMLCWQPIMLTLIAATQFWRIPDLLSLGLRVRGAHIAGLSAPFDCFKPVTSSEQAMVEGAAQLRSFLDLALRQLSDLIAINPKLAQRLFADRLLSTLIMIRQAHDDALPAQNPEQQAKRHSETFRLAEHWLGLLNLKDASALMLIPVTADNSEQSQRLALNRKGCCQHFRRTNGEVCPNCPKHVLSERIQKIQRRWADPRS